MVKLSILGLNYYLLKLFFFVSHRDEKSKKKTKINEKCNLLAVTIAWSENREKLTLITGRPGGGEGANFRV